MPTPFDHKDPNLQSLLMGRSSLIYYAKEDRGAFHGFAKKMGKSAGPEGLLDVFRPTKPIFAFDVEATGLEKGSQITQMAGIALDPQFNPIENSMIDIISKPTVPLGGEAYEKMREGGITRELIDRVGISQEDAKTAILAKLEELHGIHGQMSPMGHNVRYDLDRLEDLIGADNINKYFDTSNVLDSMTLARVYQGATGTKELESVRLPAVAEHLGVPFTGAHNAISDIFATVTSYRRMFNRLGGQVTPNDEALEVARASFRSIAPPVASRATSAVKKLSAETASVMSTVKAKFPVGYALVGAGIVGGIYLASNSLSSDNTPVRAHLELNKSRVRSQRSQFVGPMIESVPPTHPVRSRAERG